MALLFTFLSPVCIAESVDESRTWQLNGFVESRLGLFTSPNPGQKDVSVGETRLQLEVENDIDDNTLTLVADLVLDPVSGIRSPDLNDGRGFVDLRQANIVMSPLDSVDVKFGRQILTWGTGDLLFINDLFAKDWNSFLIGRDVEYLKAPTDAVKVSVFHDVFNIDVVYTPRFTADRFIDGNRISFFDRANNSRRGREQPLTVDKPNELFSDNELGLRLYRSVGVNEVALYYYHGFWKSPAGMSEVSGKGIFPSLEVWGASIRGPLAGGIGSLEVGSYRSRDTDGSDPFIRNSEYRFLTGYEHELATDLTGSVQYYLEHKRDYGAYVASLTAEAVRDDKNRQVVTIRLTKLLFQQNLSLSLFNAYSPSDRDGYLRFIVSYKVSDELKTESGLNYFFGDNEHTFYGQFEQNSNIYAAIRYTF